MLCLSVKFIRVEDTRKLEISIKSPRYFRFLSISACYLINKLNSIPGSYLIKLADCLYMEHQVSTAQVFHHKKQVVLETNVKYLREKSFAFQKFSISKRNTDVPRGLITNQVSGRADKKNTRLGLEGYATLT